MDKHDLIEIPRQLLELICLSFLCVYVIFCVIFKYMVPKCVNVVQVSPEFYFSFFLQFKRFNAYDKSHTQPFAYDTFTPKLDTSSSFVCLFIRLELMMKDYF